MPKPEGTPTVVVPTDFSNSGDAAIPHAFRSPKDRGARVDIRYATKEEEVEVGRRQSELRRLLENFSRYWRDPKSIARVSQIINSAQIN